MLLLVIGFLIIGVAALNIRFPELVNALRENDPQQWQTLAAPPTFAFHKTIGVFSWVLGHGFEQSSSSDVIALGKKALQKAQMVKYGMLAGVGLVCLGFILALAGF